MTIPSAASVFRDHDIENVPASGPHEPVKRDIRALLSSFETLLGAGTAGLVFSTLAALSGDLAHPANTSAIVFNDSTGANNGIFEKVGPTSTGSWSRVGDLPWPIVPFTVTGGTGNAIVATAPEVPLQPGRKLYTLVPTANNTAAVTVNGVAIKNVFGLDLAANSLVANSPVIMIWSVDHYVLLLSAQVDANSVLAATLAAQSAAQGYATAAAASASVIGNQAYQFDSRALAAAATIPAGVKALRTYGLTTVGDSPPKDYVRGTIGDPDSFADAGGNYWKPAPESTAVSDVNCSFAISVASNALTIALKNTAGTDPSAAAPVVLTYRSPTVTTSTPVQRKVTAANSITVPNGGTLGTSNTKPFRIWIVMFDDAGTQRLGVILASSSGNMADLKGWPIASSALVSGSATAALTFYTAGAGVSAKSFVVLGWASWESGLVTAGAWSGGPSRVHVQTEGSALPGEVIQSKQASNTGQSDTTNTTYTATATAVTITPTSAANAIAIYARSLLGQVTSNAHAQAKILRGGTELGYPADVFINHAGLSAVIQGQVLEVTDFPGTAVSTTYTVGIKTTAGGIAVWNSAALGDGGATISAQEIMQ